MAKYVKAKDVKIGEKVCVRFKDKKTGKAETVTGWVVPGTRYTFRVQEKKYADDPVCVSKKNIVSVVMLDPVIFRKKEDESSLFMYRSGNLSIMSNEGIYVSRISEKHFKSFRKLLSLFENNDMGFHLTGFGDAELTLRESYRLTKLLIHPTPIPAGRREASSFFGRRALTINGKKVVSPRQSITVREGDRVVVSFPCGPGTPKGTPYFRSYRGVKNHKKKT